MIFVDFLRNVQGQSNMARTPDLYFLRPTQEQEQISNLILTVQVSVASPFNPAGFAAQVGALVNGIQLRYRRGQNFRTLGTAIRRNADLISLGEPFLLGTLLQVRIRDLLAEPINFHQDDAIEVITADDLTFAQGLRVQASYDLRRLPRPSANQIAPQQS